MADLASKLAVLEQDLPDLVDPVPLMRALIEVAKEALVGIDHHPSDECPVCEALNALDAALTEPAEE